MFIEEKLLIMYYKEKFKFVIWNKSDFYQRAIENEGYMVKEAYIHSTNMIIASIRQMWFKFKLPYCEIWYNKQLVNFDGTFILFDAMMYEKFVKWLRVNNPNARIIFWYWNIITEKKIRPSFLKNLNIETWSFDKKDCVKYNLSYSENFYCKSPYEEILYFDKNRTIKYDLVFIGKDKGRLKMVEELKYDDDFKNLNWYTYFTANHFYQKFSNFEYRKKNLTYKQVLLKQLMGKAILELVPPNSAGVTIRTLDALNLNIKLITNNFEIVKMDFYNPDNIFVLGLDHNKDIKKFLNSPYNKIDKNIINNYQLEKWVERFEKNRDK